MTPWEDAYRDAVASLDANPDLEPTSAFRQAGHDHGIEWGRSMGDFVAWARQKYTGEP